MPLAELSPEELILVRTEVDNAVSGRPLNLDVVKRYAREIGELSAKLGARET